MPISLSGINAALIKADIKITQIATSMTETKAQLKTMQSKLELLERIRRRLVDAKRSLELANENEGELN